MFRKFQRRGLTSYKSLLLRSTAIMAGIGVQGLVGWWMVRSGLEEPDKYAVPRVSQYRLAVHFGTALALFSGMLWTTLDLFHKPGLSVLPEKSVLRDTASSSFADAMRHFRRLRAGAAVCAGMVALTALSGAFVAGLDAGLIYNEFPKMGGDWVPEGSWEFSTVARTVTKRSPSRIPGWLRDNLFENSASVQFNHRLLGVSTVSGITALYVYFHRTLKSSLPPRVRMAMGTLLGMAWLQATLGITTLLTFVPVPLAASHQAGSLCLLSSVLC